MNRRRILGIVGAVLLTLFGTVVLLAYVNSADRRARQGATLVEVLVATDTIPQGTPATEINDRVEDQEVPQNVRPRDAVTNVGDLRNRVTAVDIVPGEMLLDSRFVADDEIQQRGGEGLEDPENQLVAIALEPQRAAGGRLSVDQLVGVVASFDDAPASDTPPGEESDAEQGDAASAVTQMLLPKVRVAAVSGGPDAEGGGAGGSFTVSLELGTADAEKLIFAAEHGRIWLTQQTRRTATEGGLPRTVGNVLPDLAGDVSG